MYHPLALKALSFTRALLIFTCTGVLTSLQLDEDTPSSRSSDNEDDLPYPAELPRSAFLTPTFTPTSYLATLTSRHQTLEDLRSDLRERSALLSRELLDLVNTHYQGFLSLGESLNGGEEKVEEVRVGLLGFRNDVTGVRDSLRSRRVEVQGLLKQRKDVRMQIGIGQSLLEVAERLEELEERLMVTSVGRSIEDG